MTLQKKLFIGTAVAGGIGLVAVFIFLQTIDSLLFDDEWELDWDYMIK